MNGFDNTKEWALYKKGLDYDSKLDYHNKSDLHWNFYNSKQWIGITTNGLSKWTFNICKSAISYFVAFVCSQKIKMSYNAENIPDEPETEEIPQLDENGQPAVDTQGQPVMDAQYTQTGQVQLEKQEFVTLMSDMAELKWEKEKMDQKLREAVLDGSIVGDYYAYTYWDMAKKTGQPEDGEQGDFTTEIVDGVNVMYGNPNNPNVEAQPYILIVRRTMVEELKAKAKANGIDEDLIKTISSDEENTYQTGKGKIEMDNTDDTGKALSIIKFWKEDGTVWMNESTRYCPIVEKVDMRISLYPIAGANWETIKNSHRGMSAIEGIIDNQISINQLFAMVSYWMKFMAFGKVIYDGSKIEKYTNKIGEALKSNGPVGNDVVHQLEAGKFNAAALTVIDMAIKYTKDFIGANDNLMGLTDPEKASGVAIISSGKQASIPLGSPSANRDQFVEDIGLIWGEFFLKKYVNRTVTFRRDGKVMVGQFNTEGKTDLLLNCMVDVGAATIYSEQVGIEQLQFLLGSDRITTLQYLERVKDLHLMPDTQGLIEDEQERIDQEQEQLKLQAEQQAQLQQQPQATNGLTDEDRAIMLDFFNALPKEQQMYINTLTPDEQDKKVIEMMNTQGEESDTDLKIQELMQRLGG